MRYESKDAFLRAVREEYEALDRLLREIPEARRDEQGVWGDGWTVTDLVAHLAEWHHLFLGWYEAGVAGTQPQMPAPGYKWNETPRLNRAIREKHRGRPYGAVREELATTHARLLALAEGLPEEQLMRSGSFRWTGKYPLTTYLGPNTASHYRFACKVLKRWLRGERRVPGPRRKD